ncbi:hypothetical protein ACIGG9_01460 [Pseudonocardia alni]|uniref:hypothetical protein n=1 Tax=Pseudonocardia alni TaxID=33907 RepID=UPI0033E8869B
MTGPQHRPSPGPRGADADLARPSPRPRHGFDDHEFPEDSYQGGYPDLRSSRPVERATPTDPEGFGELYGGTGPQPTVGRGGYAAPMRYEGYGAPVPAGGSQPGGDDPDDGGYGPYGRAAHRQPEEPVTPTRAAYGEYGDPGSRGGTAIDGGPPYPGPTGSGYGRARTPEEDEPVRPAVPYDDPDHVADHEDLPRDEVVGDGPPAAATSARDSVDDRAGYDRAGHGRPGYGESGGTAVVERSAVGTGAGAVPAPRPPSESGGRRPATVAEAAAARFGATGRSADTAAAAPAVEATGPVTTTPRAAAAAPAAPATAAAPVRVAKDPTALTVLRVLTYLLVSLSCLVFLAGVVYGLVMYLEFRSALGTSPLFGGGTPFGSY